MTRRNIALLILALLAILVLGGAWYLYSGSGKDEPEAMQTFTPPPLSENPPFNGDAIDDLARQYEKEGK